MKIEEMIAANRADCSGCEACVNICPKNAIKLVRDAEGFAYPKINPELCIKCGRCDAVCPTLNFEKKIADVLPSTFAAIYPDDKILRHSSSGAIFTALSEIVLNAGGLVFGAGFDKNFHVVHTVAKNPIELENLRGSKYVQSQIGGVFRQVRDALKTSFVLFSGTPCQCVGLKHFLGKDYDNLLTVEIICHGVPSPALWESYIGELGHAHEVKHVNFRSKQNGWNPKIYMSVNFADKGLKMNTVIGDLYGKLFLRNVSLRPSCSNCKARFPNGRSDLTLGDAWGISDFAPEMNDKRGVSVVFVHSAKGKAFFERANLKAKQIKFADAVNKNRLFIAPTVADSRRKNFFADLAKSNDWFYVMQRYYAQDDEESRKETSREQGRVYRKNLQDILTPIRQKFAKNILVASSIRDKDSQSLLENFFEQSFKGCGLYFLQPKDEGQFICSENFSGLTFDLKDSDALSNFVKQYNIGDICVEKPLNFGDKLLAFAEWLKSSGLPVKLFAQKTN